MYDQATPSCTSQVLHDLFKFFAVGADDMLHAAYLTIGKLAPDYENVELSVGGSTVAAAVVEATGVACFNSQRDACLGSTP